MKLKSLAQILTAFGLVLGAVFKISQPSYAKPNTFFCGTMNGVPVTMAHTSRGDIPIIMWRRYFSNSGWTTERRCIEVAIRLQKIYKIDKINYLTTGVINDYSVVCLTRVLGGYCTTDSLLLTLKPGTDNSRILQSILRISNPTSGLFKEVEGRIYINMNEYLNTRLVEEGSSTVEEGSSPEFSQPPPPDDGYGGRIRGTGSR